MKFTKRIVVLSLLMGYGSAWCADSSQQKDILNDIVRRSAAAGIHLRNTNEYYNISYSGFDSHVQTLEPGKTVQVYPVHECKEGESQSIVTQIVPKVSQTLCSVLYGSESTEPQTTKVNFHELVRDSSKERVVIYSGQSAVVNTVKISPEERSKALAKEFKKRLPYHEKEVVQFFKATTSSFNE